MTKAAEKPSRMLYVIGGLKIVKALFLLALTIAALNFIGKNISEEIKRLGQKLFFDADNKYLTKIVEKVSGLNANKLSLLSAGTFLYSALFFVEGIGLILQQTWAEYLTIIITASFLPLEIYELIKEFSLLKTGVLIANIAIVIYLIWRLYRQKKNKKANA